MYILKVEEDMMTIKNVITQEPFYIGCGLPMLALPFLKKDIYL